MVCADSSGFTPREKECMHVTDWAKDSVPSAQGECNGRTFDGPAALLVEFSRLFAPGSLPGPILDLACGDCRNGIFLARRNLPVVCCDKSQESLERAREAARESGVTVRIRRVDLEMEGSNPLEQDYYGAILVFRYLHRPLFPSIRSALREGGILVYETYTTLQPMFGKPHNPAFLLEPGELFDAFKDWEIIHYFEGIKESPRRAVARIICRKPLRGGG